MHRTADQINFRWLLRLRWFGYLGLTLTAIVAENILHLHVARLPVATAVVVGIASNLVGHLWAKPRSLSLRHAPFVVLVIDALMITLVLWASGGSANPFVLAYLVPLVVAAVMLGRRSTLALFALCVTCVIGIVVAHQPLRADHEHLRVDHEHGARDALSERIGPTHAVEHSRPNLGPDEHVSEHLHGLSLALIVMGALVIYLVRWALGQRESELRALRAEQERNERLIELSTLAASAAHELGNPLSTIAVVAAELERKLAEGVDGERTIDDVRVIREQIKRCRTVLSNLGNDARSGEQKERVQLGQLLNAVRDAADTPERLRIEVSARDAKHELWLPRRTLFNVLDALVSNGLQARSDEQVLIKARVDAGWLIEVIDHGPGILREQLARLGHEPVPSSSQGMGIGLFLGRAVLERLGGELDLASDAGMTRAHLWLPAQAREARESIAGGMLLRESRRPNG